MVAGEDLGIAPHSAMNFFMRHKISRYVLAVVATALATGVLIMFRERVNVTTIALAFLLIVLFVAAFLGSRPALVASIVGMLAFNYFFLPRSAD